MDKQRGEKDWPSEREYHSTPVQMKEFVGSAIWNDFIAYLDESIHLLQFEVEQAESMEDVKRIQGQLKEVRIFKELPSILLQDMEAQIKSKERKDGRDSSEQANSRT